MTDKGWPERVYRMVEIAPGVYAMRDTAQDARMMADTELIDAAYSN